MDAIWDILLAVLVTAGVYLAFWHFTRPVNQETIYELPFGRVLCAERTITDCGVTLRKCHDARIYTCMHNVRFEDTDGP